MTPAARRDCAALAALCLVAAAALGLSPAASAATGDAVELDLSKAHSPHSIPELTAGGDGLRLLADGPDPYFELPIARRIEQAKLRVTFSELSGIDRVQIFYGLEDWPYSEARQTALRPGRGARVIREFPLVDGWYRAVRVDLDPATGRGPVHIVSASIVPADAVDHPLLPYLAALGIAASLLLPGALLLVVAVRREPADDGFPLLGYAASLAFFAAALLALLLTRGGPAYPEIVPAVVAGLFLALVVLAVLRGRLLMAIALPARQPAALAAYAGVVLLACHVVVSDTPLPFSNLHYQSVSGPKTFNAFRAHDNVFQYVNGASLADDVPLSEPYRHGRLMYLPQDRAILPGALYAVYRTSLARIEARLGESFLTYTLLAIACNAMVLFPLFAFVQRYLRPSPALVIAAVCLTAYAVVNFYFAWFKFSGAALFLSALLLLLANEDRLRAWLGAGALWGLSAGMHAGNALGFPFYYAWLVVRRFRAHGAGAPSSYLYPALFLAAYGATVLPWAIVKHLHYPDTHALLRSFLIAGKHHPGGLLESIGLFFAETPLREQLLVRMSNLYNTFRIEGTLDTLGLLADGRFEQWMLAWNQMEFSRTAVLFYPLFGFLVLGRLVSRLAGHRYTPHSARFIREAPEAATVLWLGVATFLTVVLIAFGRFPPDVTYHHPAGVILLAYTVLAARVLAAHGLVVALFLAYLAFSAFRLGLFL